MAHCRYQPSPTLSAVIRFHQPSFPIRLDGFEFFEAEMVQVIYPSNGEPLPLPMTTYQASLEENQGWLSVITDTVSTNVSIDAFFVDDGSSLVRIFLDGYNGDFRNVQVNDLVHVTGLVSEDGDGGRIRVRNHGMHPEYADDVVWLTHIN